MRNDENVMITDEELVKKYKAGDESAFETLYYRYVKLVNSFSRSLFLTGGDEDDLKQEGMLGLVYAINTYDDSKGTFMTFAYLCIKSRMINAVKGDVADKHKPLNLAVSISDLDIEGDFISMITPESVVIRKESVKELMEKVKSNLSEFEIEVFCKYLEGLNYKEIAEKLQVSAKSCDNALQRIKEKCKKIRS
ncbi:MAG: sigma-70 family RNA polymerase sigma factor [Christensenellaceae bacterium]